VLGRSEDKSTTAVATGHENNLKRTGVARGAVDAGAPSGRETIVGLNLWGGF